jgi:6-phosphogluconolactonase
VLAGGTTPKRCYEILAGMSLSWGRVTVLFGDERCVGPFDPESNYRVAFEALLRHVAPASVHRMAGELGAEEGAARYESVVAAGPLDLVLLGLGADGHIASLFPDNPALAAGGAVATVHDAPKPPPDRITLTLGTLRAARRVIVLVGGADKREAVRRALAGEVPAAMVQNAEWHVTADAFG